MDAFSLSRFCTMAILPGWAKYLPSWDLVSEGGDAVPTCFLCYVEMPVLGGIPVLGGCLVQLLGACIPGSASGVACPAEVPSASGAKCLCPVLLCMATWEAIQNSEEVPCNQVISSKLTCLDLQVDVTCCSQLLPAK